MEIDINPIVAIIFQMLKAFFQSGFFGFVKFILAIYVSVLFIDVVLLLVVRGLGGNIRDTLKGAHMPLKSKNKIKKDWLMIEDRLKLKNQQQNKIAILEADKLVDEILFNIGYEGNNMKERLASADSKQLEEVDNLIEAHEIRNRIIYENNFFVSQEEAERVIGLYREFLDNLEII